MSDAKPTHRIILHEDTFFIFGFRLTVLFGLTAFYCQADAAEPRARACGWQWCKIQFWSVAAMGTQSVGAFSLRQAYG
jgi:hypothetical protein